MTRYLPLLFFGLLGCQSAAPVWSAGPAGDSLAARSVSATRSTAAVEAGDKRCPCVYALSQPPKKRHTGLTAYGVGAQGDVAPVFKLFSRGWGLAVDAQGYIYMTTTGNNFVVFAPHAHGKAVPVREVSGPHTGLNGSTGIAVDNDGNVYIGDTGDEPSGPFFVTVYPPGANGDVAPIQNHFGLQYRHIVSVEPGRGLGAQHLRQ